MGTLTVNTTTAQDTRILAAVGKQHGFVDGNGDPRDATPAEVKGVVIQFLKELVLRQERQDAANIAADAVTEITPT